MRRLADPIYPAAIRQLLARNCEAKLLADDTGQSAPDDVRLPAGRIDHVADRCAFRAPQEPHERALATSLGWSRMSSRDVGSTRSSGRFSRRRHCLSLHRQLAGVRGSKTEGATFPVMAPNRHRIECGHLLKQPTLQQALAYVPYRPSLELSQDGEHAQVFTRAGWLQDRTLGVGQLHDHDERSSSKAAARLPRFYEVEPQGWDRRADAVSPARADTCSNRDLKQAASAAED